MSKTFRSKASAGARSVPSVPVTTAAAPPAGRRQSGHVRRAQAKPQPRQGLAAGAALTGLAIDLLPHGLSVFDAQDRLVLANQSFRSIWRLPDALCQPGAQFDDIIRASHGATLVLDRTEPADTADGTQRRHREWRTLDDRTIEVSITRLPDGGCVALHQDISERRQAQQQVAHWARHDVLTGLPNRGHLRELLLRELPRTQRGEELAVLCLDLDRFKNVNDTLGHAAGDLLLRQVAERLNTCVREGDAVARLGGDEFAVLQVSTTQPGGSAALGKRLIEQLSKPFNLAGHLAHIGTSVGIAVAPFDGDDAEALLKHADLALYSAKASGRGQLRFFETAMDQRLLLRQGLEADLRSALALQQFELAYQAQVDANSQAVVGVEALLRWNHPTRGRVSPLDFITLAEETGLIIPIGQWVLRQACLAAAHWPDSVIVAVNLSAVQFGSRSLVQDVLSALAEAGLPARRLELEITESVLLDDTEQNLQLLHALRQHGVRISMDDFGTGYSSLSYLRRFPFDRIKIDRSFVTDVAKGGDALALIGAISGLGKSLGMATTAEGVETCEQLQAVKDAGCTDVQGFLFSRPGPAQAVDALILAGPVPALKENPNV